MSLGGTYTHYKRGRLEEDAIGFGKAYERRRRRYQGDERVSHHEESRGVFAPLPFISLGR